MREACLYNNWSSVPIFLKIYRALMRWTPWSFKFLGRWRWSSPRDGGTRVPRMRSGGSGDEGFLPNSFGWEFILFIKTHFYGGALTSHFMEEHSSPTSIFLVFMMTSSNGNMFRVTGFCAGNSTMTAGNSPVTDEFPSHRPVTRSFDVFFDLRLNKGLSKQSSHRWFETPSLSLWRHCNVVPNSDPVIRAAGGSFGIQRVAVVQFCIGETGQIVGGGWGGCGCGVWWVWVWGGWVWGWGVGVWGGGGGGVWVWGMGVPCMEGMA